MLKITIFTRDIKKIPAVSYTTPLQKVFHMNATDNDNELDYSNTTTDVLKRSLLTVSFTMKELFPIRWTNEVFCKFLLINIKSPDVLLCHIVDGTLNHKLNANDHLSMNSTTLQVLAPASPGFNIRSSINNSLTDTTPWSIRKKKRCFNCKTIGCNMWNCLQLIDKAEYNRDKAAYIKLIDEAE